MYKIEFLKYWNIFDKGSKVPYDINTKASF